MSTQRGPLRGNRRDPGEGPGAQGAGSSTGAGTVLAGKEKQTGACKDSSTKATGH